MTGLVVTAVVGVIYTLVVVIAALLVVLAGAFDAGCGGRALNGVLADLIAPGRASIEGAADETGRTRPFGVTLPLSGLNAGGGDE